MTPSYPAVVELIRQLDQEKIDTLTKRVEDLRNQNQELKVLIYAERERRAYAPDPLSNIPTADIEPCIFNIA